MFRACADRHQLIEQVPRWLGALLLVLSLAGCGREPPPASSSPTAPPANVIASSETSAAEPSAAPGLDVNQAAEFSETKVPPEASANAGSVQALNLRLGDSRTPTLARWKEGVHYSVLVPTQPTQATPGQIEVVEAFWYGCPHCYALDPVLEKWRQQGKPPYVSFTRLPVMWGHIQRSHAQLFYTAAALGQLDKLHAVIFKSIQDKQILDNAASIADFFTTHGISAADFHKAYESAGVAASLKQAEMLGLRYHIDLVPMIIVNGKYVTDVGRAGGAAQLITLINDLAALEKGNVK